VSTLDVGLVQHRHGVQDSGRQCVRIHVVRLVAASVAAVVGEHHPMLVGKRAHQRILLRLLEGVREAGVDQDW